MPKAQCCDFLLDYKCINNCSQQMYAASQSIACIQSTACLPCNLSGVSSSCKARRLRHSIARLALPQAVQQRAPQVQQRAPLFLTQDTDGDVLAPPKPRQAPPTTTPPQSTSVGHFTTVNGGELAPTEPREPTASKNKRKRVPRTQALSLTAPARGAANVLDGQGLKQALRESCRDWPFIHVRPTRSVGSMAGFTNKVRTHV